MATLTTGRDHDLEKRALAAFLENGNVRPGEIEPFVGAVDARVIPLIRVPQHTSLMQFTTSGIAIDTVPLRTIWYNLSITVPHQQSEPGHLGVVQLSFNHEPTTDLCRKMLNCMEAAALTLGINELVTLNEATGSHYLFPESQIYPWALIGYTWQHMRFPARSQYIRVSDGNWHKPL